MTRLFYERMILDNFPDLLWVRVCTSAPYTVTVYACDAEMDLSDSKIKALKQFLSDQGMASCVHNVKHYFELQNDEAFPIGQIPNDGQGNSPFRKCIASRGKICVESCISSY